MTTDNQKAFAVLSKYERLYTENHGAKPKMNRYREKWGIIDAIADLGEERVYDLLDFYFLTTGSHTMSWFLNHYDTLNDSYEKDMADREHRKELRRITEERVKRYREQYGDNSRATD
jgi:hypothetical protein